MSPYRTYGKMTGCFATAIGTDYVLRVEHYGEHVKNEKTYSISEYRKLYRTAPQDLIVWMRPLEALRDKQLEKLETKTWWQRLFPDTGRR